jgi:prevent-host-death family protein
MDSIGAFEAKTQFSQLLERVAGGEQITITRHGVPVARLVPAARPSREDVARAVVELEEFQAGVTLNPPDTDRLTVRNLIDEGRQW